jgi:uncharacterized spore protein YtfJ
MADYSQAVQQAETAANGKFSGFIEGLADRVGGQASSRAVFGEPVELDGVTVITVAKVRWGFGGGGGSGSGGKDEAHMGSGQGAGGGGGATANPVGFIEISNGRAQFRRIYDFSSLVPLLLGGAVAWLLVVRGLRRLFR